MLVKELIEFLQKQPQDIKVAYRLCSEQCLLQSEEIEIVDLCHPRDDGWVQNKRRDKPTETYLLLPGN
jgi:hypothetical protein